MSAALHPAASDPLAPTTQAFARVREALRPRALPVAPRPERQAAAALAELGGGGVAGVLFFGSQRTKASPDAFSAYDLFVAVDAYRPFYRALRSAARVRRSPTLLAVLNALLTPNQISLRLPDGRGGELLAKCSVITLADLQRETSARRRDHFTLGRLFQPVEILWARDNGAREALLDALASAAACTPVWGRPFLEERFDAELYLRTLLRVSLGREVRPEPTGGRADALHEAQRGEQLPVYRALLEGLAADGALRQAADGSAALGSSRPGAPEAREAVYEWVRPVAFLERLRVGLYFRVSTVRATLRWFKYVVTFDDWLLYILHKAERHTGQKIVLSARERAWPFLFLWPRLFRYLREKEGGES